MKRLLKYGKRLALKIVPGSLQSFYHNLAVRDQNELSRGEVQFFNLIKDYVHIMVDVGARTDTFYANSPSRPGNNRKVYMFEANPAFARKLLSTTPYLGQHNFVYNVAIG